MPGIKDSDSGSGVSGAVKEKRTRRRIIKCCENCRSSKNKCSKHPDACERCLTNQLKCVYLPQDNEGWEVIEKGKEERRKIENRIAKRARREEGFEEESEDESDIEPSPLIATDAAYEDDDDVEDHGVQIGRFNLTKRIGSNYRPKMIEELTQTLDQNDLERTDYDRQVFDSLPPPRWSDAAAVPQVVDPNPDYIAPSLFSHALNTNQHARKILRSQDLTDRIMRHYWEFVHPVARIVHRPSFQEKYEFFWYSAARGMKDIPESTQALVYATLFAGVVSMDAETVREELGGEREEWVQILEKAAANSLSRAHVIRTEKPETIQAFVMYLIPMCRSVISRTVATLVASAIDLARGMGLNKDGTNYGDDAVVTQVHRMIWHQLCFLDIRVCEAQSPRARIRKDEYDTQIPLNVEDSELEGFDLPKERSDRWTSMTLSNARMECNEKIREIYAYRQRIRQGDESDSAYIKRMLEIIFDFQQYMEKKYFPMIDDDISIQHYTRLIIQLHCRRMHGIVLHEYHMSTPQGRMPEQWSRTVIKSGLETMEIAKEIETSDILRPWRWYAGALQQHSYATLILIDVFGCPGRDYAKRAWESLDWIFQVPSCVPHIHKGRWVLEAALRVIKEYLKARKLRCPILMDERLGILPSRLPTPALSQPLVTSDLRASRHDMPVNGDAQTMPMRGISHTNTKQERTFRNLTASASYPGRLELISTQGDSSDGSMDTTSSWQSVVDTKLPIEHSGYSTRDSVARPSTYLGSRGARGDRGETEDSSRAGSSECAPDHMVYYPHQTLNMNTTPPHNLKYEPTGNDSWHNIPPRHSITDSLNNPQLLDEGSCVHFPDYIPSATSRDFSAFTPINQDHSAPHPPRLYYRPPYVTQSKHVPLR